MKKSTHTTGFTIVELLIVIVVIAVLAAISVIIYKGITVRAKDSATETSVRNIEMKTSELGVENGRYPIELLLTPGEDNKLSTVHLAQLQASGLPIGLLRNPSAPDGFLSSIRFASDKFGNRRFSDASTNESFQISKPPDVPNGFASWDEVFEKLDNLMTEHPPSEEAVGAYIESHPPPELPEDESELTETQITAMNNWYRAFYRDAYFAHAGTEYQAAIAAYDVYIVHMLVPNPPTIDIPKTSFYFLEVLSSGVTPDSLCYLTTTGTGQDDYKNTLLCYRNTVVTEFILNLGIDDPISPTGYRIHYYNYTERKWKMRQVGTGDPIPRYIF